MEKTANYQLNQWDAADPIRREDFNSDNAALDAVLGALAAGQLHVATGAYTGAGAYGSSNANTLTFDFKPLLVVVSSVNSGANGGSVWLRETKKGRTYSDAGIATLTWGDASLSWYSDSNSYQLNNGNTNYCYLALGIKE